MGGESGAGVAGRRRVAGARWVCIYGSMPAAAGVGGIIGGRGSGGSNAWGRAHERRHRRVVKVEVKAKVEVEVEVEVVVVAGGVR